MNNFNYLVIEGHLCQDPVITEVIPGRSVCRFTIAVNRSFLIKEKKNEYMTETSFFPVNAWGDLGILCQKYLKQGRGIRIVGHLKQERWQLGENNYKQRVVIVAEHIEFMPQYKKQEEEKKEFDQEAKDVMETNSTTNATETEAPPAELTPGTEETIDNFEPEPPEEK